MKIISLDKWKKSVATKKNPKPKKLGRFDGVASRAVNGAPACIEVLPQRKNIDEIRASLVTAGMPLSMMTKLVDTVQEGDVLASYTMSDDSVDRPGDRIMQEGWDLEEYRANPQFLFGHDSSSPPIGKALGVYVARGALKGTFKFMPESISSFAAMIGRMVKGDAAGSYLPAGSVGFKPRDYRVAEERMDPNDEWAWLSPPIDFLKQLLLEFSSVPIPANANALIDGAKGLLPALSGSDAKLLREWAAKMIAGEGGLIIPRSLAEQMDSSGKLIVDVKALKAYGDEDDDGDEEEEDEKETVPTEVKADNGRCPECGHEAPLSAFEKPADEGDKDTTPISEASTEALLRALARRGVKLNVEAQEAKKDPTPAPTKSDAPPKAPALHKQSEPWHPDFDSPEAVGKFVEEATKKAVAEVMLQQRGRLPD